MNWVQLLDRADHGGPPADRFASSCVSHDTRLAWRDLAGPALIPSIKKLSPEEGPIRISSQPLIVFIFCISYVYFVCTAIKPI